MLERLTWNYQKALPLLLSSDYLVLPHPCSRYHSQGDCDSTASSSWCSWLSLRTWGRNLSAHECVMLTDYPTSPGLFHGPRTELHTSETPGQFIRKTQGNTKHRSTRASPSTCRVAECYCNTFRQRSEGQDWCLKERESFLKPTHSLDPR